MIGYDYSTHALPAKGDHSLLQEFYKSFEQKKGISQKMPF